MSLSLSASPEFMRTSAEEICEGEEEVDLHVVVTFKRWGLLTPGHAKGIVLIDRSILVCCFLVCI